MKQWRENPKIQKKEDKYRKIKKSKKLKNKEDGIYSK